MSLSLIIFHMRRAISSPSMSTTGLATLILEVEAVATGRFGGDVL